MARNKKNANRVKKTALMCLLCGILLITSTYAWFIGMQSVSVSQFDVTIAAAEGLSLSMDGDKWFDEEPMAAHTVAAYDGNKNTWAKEGLIPMSTVGDTDASVSEMVLFEKGSLTATKGGYRLLASRVNYATSADDLKNGKGYVAFDLFIRNKSGEEYYAKNDVANEEAIYLTTDSKVIVSETGGVANTGIENSVRVGFVQIGRVEQDGAAAANITGITCSDDSAKGVTGICRTATIWEPNDTKHVQNALNWYDKSCKERTGSTVAYGSYGAANSCKPLNTTTAYTTYAIANKLEVGTEVDVYDGTDYNKYTANEISYSAYMAKDASGKSSAKLVAMDYFTDTEKAKVGVERPTFMTLAPNSVTKVRVYVWIEGQDIDNYDFSSLGKQITVNFGFTKERFEQSEIISPSA
jgi:hypothetical protein